MMSPIRSLVLALLLPLLAACAAGGGSKPALSDEEQLTARAVERWDHLIAKRADQAWEYLSPGYRSVRNREEYVATMGNRPVRWLSVEYHSYLCREPGSFCEVNLKVNYSTVSRQIGVGEIKSYGYLTERWIKTGGTWYHVPDDVTG